MGKVAAISIILAMFGGLMWGVCLKENKRLERELAMANKEVRWWNQVGFERGQRVRVLKEHIDHWEKANADMGQFLFVDLDKDGRPVDHKRGKEVVMLEIGGKFVYPDWIDHPRIDGSPDFEKLWLDRDPRVYKPVYSSKVMQKFPRD